MPSKSRDFWDLQWKERLHGMANTSAFNLFRVDDIRGKSVLDVGCGDVKYPKLEALAGDFTGADISINALSCAKERDSRRKLVVCDAENLPFGSDTFDSVCSTDTLTLLGEGWYKALEEMRRVTRGVVVFNVSHIDYPKTDLAMELELKLMALVENGSCTILKTQKMPDRAFFDEDGICRILRKLGLILKDMRVLTANEERNLGVNEWEQREEPDMDFKQKIFVRALKRQ
ncbi:MAG: class I SAM-dependent methyltransferase [Candidatus Micrarchaeaceae archaeon]|jgi:SAM-dependent methyltransferase|nr:class I SAM-dependent methyltransferase [Candidatus Micrarchaeota archaeon]HII09952.1 class I SAM-dependent methyltransferase [Candidatus Micrarchaeota archaeon]